MRKHETRAEAMSTEKGKEIYDILSAHFENGLSRSPSAVRKAIEENMTYLGSEHFLEGLVFEILNEMESGVKND